jgi:surfactin synthase thioesterase subunit
VELPGRGTRLAEPLLYSMDKVVDGLLSMLESRPEREGFLFFGHSMGAKIAYETTRRLTVAGRPLPRAVVVSCSRPPGSPVAVPLHDHDDGDLLEGIIEIGGIPAELRQRPDLLRILLPVMRADLVLEARYAEQVRPTVLPCPIVALTGADDRYAGPQWIGGWRTMTKGAFRYRIFPGEHFFLQEQVAEVIAEIAHIAAGTLPDEVWAQTSSP